MQQALHLQLELSQLVSHRGLLSVPQEPARQAGQVVDPRPHAEILASEPPAKQRFEAVVSL